MLIFPEIPTQVPQRLDMLPTEDHKVDVVSFDVGVLQYIRQFNDIFIRLRKHCGEQMAQVMREHFAGDPSLLQRDVTSLTRMSVAQIVSICLDLPTSPPVFDHRKVLLL